MREAGVDEWKTDMSILLDSIPLKNWGLGTQNMFKSEIFLLQNSDVDIGVIEEPENHLSYANMPILISKLSNSSEKQLFISAHSSYVANNWITPFKVLKKATYDYFLKLPGCNT